MNVNIWTPTSVDAEIPQSSSLLSLQPERKKSTETELAKELDLMELTADEGMDRESQACKEQEMGNAAYTKNDFDTAIAHYTKVMELDDGNISCLMNRAVAYLAIGQYVECIKDCDKAVESGRKLRSDSKMIAIALTRKGTALVKMAKCSQDYEPAIKIFQKALTEHHSPDTLKELDDAIKAKRDLELLRLEHVKKKIEPLLESFDPKSADEEHKKELLSPNTGINYQRFFKMESSKASHSDKKYQNSEPTVVANPFNSDDGYRWRKYEQKLVKGNEYPRSYYKCTCVGCNARKWVEQSPAREISKMKYEGKHNHEMPNKLAKEISDLQCLARNMNIQSQLETAYSVLEKDQESTAFTLTESDCEEESVAETREEVSHFDRTYQPTIAVDKPTNDGFKWRKYGQKNNFSVYPRSYYKCTYSSCPAKKMVESSHAGHITEIVYKGTHNHPKPQPSIKCAKEGSNLSGNINSQAKPDLGLQNQAGNRNKSSQVVPAYTVPERDQESTQTALTQLTGSRDNEGEGDAETIEEGAGPNPKRRHVPIYYLAEPKIMVGKGNPYKDESSEKQIASEPHGMVFNVEPIKMTISSEPKKIEIGEIGNLASQERQPERIQVEELNIVVNPDDERWDVCAEDIVTEVCTLTRLETLKFYFPRVELLRHFHCNRPLLSHFRFTVGRHVKRIMSRVPHDVEFELERWERCLRYINGVGVPRDIKNVLQHVTAFFLDRHVTVKKLSDFGTRNMKQLKCCVVGECNEVQVIIDAQDAYGEDGISEVVSEAYDAEKIVLGSLEYLYIYYMKSLRSIWEGSVQKNSLFLLKSLTLRTCPQLTTIFTQGLLANLCNLEEIKVEDCPSIKSIVSCEISAEHRSSYLLPNLKKIALHYMPGLISISSGLQIAPKLEWLSFYNCPNLKNPLIDEISSQDLKKIKGERSWWEALEWSSSCPSYLEEIFVPIDIQDC
ncbi:hypothetical protein CMV_012361 [Castanea mollissima]|uniref:WRKY domain-containing protein n=1 Tax=Castanea mollissima TaxID=60419 RepID=A0A8J4R9M9_9ROSI|nr:hypothetical protein CMV_012361 [Castanea mollissima]